MKHRLSIASALTVAFAFILAGVGPDVTNVVTAAQNVDTVDVCHRTGNGSFRQITVSASALPGHLAHGDASGACAGGDNTAPVAYSDDDYDEFMTNGQQPPESGSLLAIDADGDDLTFSLVGDFNSEGQDVFSFNLESDGSWSAFCTGVGGSPGGRQLFFTFQWVANDGFADSNVATQAVNCWV